MKDQVHKEVFGIRKLKAGVCSVILAISFLGVDQVMADDLAAAKQAAPETETVVQAPTSESSTIEAASSPVIETSPAQVQAINQVTSSEPVVEGNSVEQSSDSSTAQTSVSSGNVTEASAVVKSAADTEVSPLNVKEFGAVGDGVTDDRQAIQDTIDAAARGLGAGKVYFPEGTYFVEEIVFLKSNTHLELHDKATILNGINQKNHPSIVFMTGLFTDDGDQVEWGPTENISFTGGTIDMNGALNEEGTKAKNLPLINSSGAFALANTTNFTIRNVTFRDSYQGHAIQIAGSKNVLVDQSRFLGQALPKTMKDSQIISKESIQIEPQTRKGFPYALNDNGKKSENVTIQNSYFGRSDKAGELVTAIGTHYQTLKTENPSNIKILNNHFDNMMYAGVRFTGFTDILIKGNVFDKKSKEDSVHYRENGAALVNAYSYKNLNDVLDLNKHVVVRDNVFNIADPKTKAIRVARDNEAYLGQVRDITITNNAIKNSSVNSEVPTIQMTRISDNLNVSGNSIIGGYQGISIENSTGNITVKDNALSGLSSHYFSMTDSGDNGQISVVTHGAGNITITTADGQYRVLASGTDSHSYEATYSDPELTNMLERKADFTVPLSQSEAFSRHLQFKPKSIVTETGELRKEYDSQNTLKVRVNESQGASSHSYYANHHLRKSNAVANMLPKTGDSMVSEAVLTLLGTGLLTGIVAHKRKKKIR